MSNSTQKVLSVDLYHYSNFLSIFITLFCNTQATVSFEKEQDAQYNVGPY